MALVPVVNDKVPVACGVSAEVERSEMVLPARDGVSAAAETNMVPESVDTVGRVSAAMQISCWDKISRPAVGLVNAEKVMRGGALDRPVLLNGLELSGLAPNEIVLRGGRLKKPSIISDLIVKTAKQFIPLDKSRGVLCEYLTGKRPSKSPLKHVHVFEQMQKVMVRYCDQRMADSDQKLRVLRTAGDEEGEANTNMQRVVGKTKKANPKAAGARGRHVQRSLLALPPNWTG